MICETIHCMFFVLRNIYTGNRDQGLSDLIMAFRDQDLTDFLLLIVSFSGCSLRGVLHILVVDLRGDRPSRSDQNIQLRMHSCRSLL